jgi:hypothetical protein
VTYTAVINVANPDQKLLPGMTANITIPVARRDDVLRVPNATLRFKPELTDQQQKDLQAKMDAFRQQQQSQAVNEADQPKGQQQTDAQNQGTATASPGPDAGRRHQKEASGDSGNHQANEQGSSANSAGKRRHQSSAGEGTPAGQQTKNQNANADSPAVPRRHQQPEAEAGSKPDNGKARPDKGDGKGTHPPEQAKNGESAQNPKPSPSPAPSPSQGDNQSTTGGGGRRGGGQRQVMAIWVLTANKTLEARIVRTGITDGRFTEIVAGDLKEGDVIVTGQSDASANSNRTPQATTPFQQRPPGAGGGRGR